MKSMTKIWLIVAILLILLGGVLFVCVMAAEGWNFSALSTYRYETEQHEITEEFSSIEIETDTADLSFVASEDGVCRVVCYEKEGLTHSVTVTDGTLSIKLADQRKWYQHIGIGFSSPTVTVYLPEGAYGALSLMGDTCDVTLAKEHSFSNVDITVKTGDVELLSPVTDAASIKATTGDVTVKGITATSLSLSTSTGDVTVEDVTLTGAFSLTVTTGKAQLSDLVCDTLTSTGDTGDVTMKRVIAADGITVKRSTGDVRLVECDAAALSITTDTGDVEGTLLSDKIFLVHTDTGNVDVPDTLTGGRCEITTDTGDVKIEIKQ